MSLIFTTDTSTQLTYSSFGFATPQLDNFSTSNQLLISSTSSSNFTIGTSNILVNRILSEIKNTSNYVLNTQNILQNNINTVSSSSSNFTTATSNILVNRILSENIINSNILVNRIVNEISNTSNYVLLSSNQIMTKVNNFYSTTGNDVNYVLKTGSTMTGALLNTSTTTSEFKGIQFAHATRISHIPYIPDGKIYLRAPVIIDNSADFLSMGARTGDFIIKLFGEDYGFGINSYTLRYNAALSASHKFYTSSTLTFTIGDTGNTTSIGSCTATSFIGSGANLTNLNYNNIPNRLTFLSPLSSNANNQISIDLSAYSLTSTINNQIANTSNYTLSVQGILQTNINTVSTSSSNFTTTTSNIIINRIVNETTNTSNYISTKFLKLDGTNAMTGLLSATTINTTGNVGIGITNPFAPLTIGSPAVNSDGFLVIAKNNLGNRNFKIGYDNAFNMCFGDFGNSTGANTWNSTDFNIRYLDGNIGMGVAASASYKLYVNGSTYINNNLNVNGNLSLKNGAWHQSMDNVYRLWFDANGPTYYSCGNTTDNHIFYNSSYSTTFKIQNNGNVITSGNNINIGGSVPTLQLKGQDYNLGVSGGIGNFSSSSIANDMILRTIAGTNLYLQAGVAGHALKIDSTNNVSIPNKLTISGEMNNAVNTWHKSSEGISRTYYDSNGTTFFQSGKISGTGNAFSFQNRESTASIFSIDAAAGAISIGSNLSNSFQLYVSAPYLTLPAYIQTLKIGSPYTFNQYLAIQPLGGNTGIGTDSAYSVETKLTIKGASTGYSQPLVRIEQTNAWDGNYCLETVGYTNLNGIRINGGDTGATIYKVASGDMGLAVNNGNILFGNSGGERMRIKSTNGYVGINTTDPKCHLQVNGIGNITNGSEYAITAGFMQSGSLTIGGVNANYGCGNNWTTNTAGILMECLDNTEIAIHDANNRVASAMAYIGGGTNRIYIGRDAGWGSTPVTISNSLIIDGSLNTGDVNGTKFTNKAGQLTAYNSNWNSTGLSGWFIGLNQFFSGNSGNGGTAYLTMTVSCQTSSQYCWFGRIFVGGGGGTYSIITDFKNPTSGSFELFVTEHWDASGNNVLRFRTGTPAIITENLRYKIYG